MHSLLPTSFSLSCLLLASLSALFLVSSRPVDLGMSSEDANEHDQVLLVGDNMTINCGEPSYPPAMLFAQDHDRDHYHVVFFGMQQVESIFERIYTFILYLHIVEPILVN